MNAGTAVTLALLLVSVVIGSRNAQIRPVVRVACALIAGNWIFHAVFGVELFLYAKHWSVAVTFALAPLVATVRPPSNRAVGALFALLLLVAAHDVMFFSHLFRALPGAP